MSDLLNSDNNQNTEQEEAQQQQEVAPQQEGSQEQREPESFLTWGEREFKSKDDVIKKFEHADSFIEQQKTELEKLQEEKARLEAELQQSKKIEDAMQEIQNRQPEQREPAENTTQQEANQPQFDEEQLLSKFEQRQQQRAIEAQQQENLKQIHEQAKARYGDKYLDELVSKAKSEGLDYDNKDELVDLAKRKPKTFSKLFGLTEESKPSPAPRGGHNVPSEPTKKTGKPSWKDIMQEVTQERGVDYNSSFHSSR
jgi:hypothetical protein